MDTIYFKIGSQKINLNSEKEWIIGRVGFGADIELNDTSISRKHAAVRVDESGGVFIKDINSVNGVKVNDVVIRPDQWEPLPIGAIVSIASETLILEDGKKQTSSNKAFKSKALVGNFKQKIIQKKRLSIGRLESSDIMLEDSTVTRRHAVISYENDTFWIEDLGSKNKTYLNGNQIKSKSQIKDSDVVTISFFTIDLLNGVSDLRKVTNAISAVAIQKKYPNGKIGLQSLSVEISQSSFVALMGPSGCGKSTLLKCLNGDNPATSGEVFIHGLSLEKNFNLVKKKIGYVPQDDIIHKELSVYKTLYLAAKLRLPDDTTNEEIDKRIDKVISSLKLDQDKQTNIRNVKVGSLSGGQRKRISIAVELLTEPTILFLDEPTSPLDPETIESFLKSLGELAKNGTTIIMVTHKPEDLNYVDQVIFLGVQGHIVFRGNASLMVPHFDAQNIVEVYSKMSNVDEVKNYYQKPVEYAIEKTNLPEVKRDKPDSLLLQLYWLSLRYLLIKLNDKGNLYLLLAQPIIISILVCLVFNKFQIGVLFLMTISAIWFGVSNAAKEIVSELSVYKRERMFNLNLHTYVLSKWIVLSVIALLQTLIFVSIIYFNFKYNTVENFEHIYLKSFWESTFFMFFIASSSTLMGLLLSSRFDTTEKVMTIVPIVLMPQILLAGVMTKIDKIAVEVCSFFTFGRWGTEGFARIQDAAGKIDGEKTETLLSVVFVQGKETNIPTGALEILDLYNKELIEKGTLIGEIFNSLNANLLVVTGLNLLFYFMIVYALKVKDSI